MATSNPIIPIYTSRGDAEAFLVYPNLFNRNGEWIGFATPERQVYSVLGYYVGYLTGEPRILRKRATSALIPRRTPPAPPGKILLPATIPLAPMMAELKVNVIDVLLEEPQLLHTLDIGEMKQDID